MRKLVTTLTLAVTMLVVAAGISTAAPAELQEKGGGVTVIGNDCLAPAGTPTDAISYVLWVTRH